MREIPELKYRKLALLLSFKYWPTLPERVRIWLDAEDLAQSCLLHLRSQVLPHLDKRKSSGSSFVYCALKNHLRDICRYYFRDRCYDPQARFSDEETCADVAHDPRLEFVESSDALRAVFSEASPELRERLLEIFGPIGIRTSHLPRVIADELSLLFKNARVSPADLRLLYRSGFRL